MTSREDWYQTSSDFYPMIGCASRHSGRILGISNETRFTEVGTVQTYEYCQSITAKRASTTKDRHLNLPPHIFLGILSFILYQMEVRGRIKPVHEVAMTKPPSIQEEVRFRLLRSDDVPATNPHNLAYRFGLQDTKGNIIPGERQAGGGILIFDFNLKVKQGKDPARPIFTGPFASGPVDDRFVYLSWFAIERGDYINRVKVRLGAIDWKMIRASQEENRPITADMTGRGPGAAMQPIAWFLS